MFRVMKIHEFDKSVFYRVACDCTDPEHDMTIELEVDEDILGLHIYSNLETSIYWGYNNWFTRQYKKIKYCFRLIFLGYIEVEQEFLFMEEEHINDFIKALQEGRDTMLDKKEKC